MGISTAASELEKWIDDYSKALLDRAYYLLSNKEDAKDVVQEVFLAAYKNRHSFQDKSSPLTWLTGILNHKVADLYKKRYGRGEIPLHFEFVFDKHGEWKESDVLNSWEQQEYSPSALFRNENFCQVFDECMERLPEQWHLVVKQCYLQERKTAEICREMNLSTNNYWKILQRSRLQLRACIDKHWFQDNQ